MPIITTVDDILIFFFQIKSLDISCELSAKQTIHMKCQDLFSPKNKNENISKCHLQQILLGALRVNP